MLKRLLRPLLVLLRIPHGSIFPVFRQKHIMRAGFGYRVILNHCYPVTHEGKVAEAVSLVVEAGKKHKKRSSIYPVRILPLWKM